MVSLLGGYWLDVVWIPTVCKVLSLRQSSSSLHSLSWRSLSDHPKLLTVLQDRAPYSIHFSIGCSLYVGYPSALLLGEFLLFKILFYHFLCETVSWFPNLSLLVSPLLQAHLCYHASLSLFPFWTMSYLRSYLHLFQCCISIRKCNDWQQLVNEWINKIMDGKLLMRF